MSACDIVNVHKNPLLSTSVDGVDDVGVVDVNLPRPVSVRHVY